MPISHCYQFLIFAKFISITDAAPKNSFFVGPKYDTWLVGVQFSQLLGLVCIFMLP